jgi:hypothetical protein
MRCTRIKQHSGRGGVDEKRTQDNVGCFSSFLCSDVVEAASSNISLSLRVPTRGSTALTLIGPWRVGAWRRWLLQGTLLGKVPRLATSVASTSLAAVGGVECVAVTPREVPASRAVARILVVRVVGPGSLRGEPLRWWRRP